MKKKRRRRLKYIILLFIILAAVIAVINSSIIIKKMTYPLKYKELVYKYSEDNKIDPYLVFAIIKAESNFDPAATSRKNARGLMQITDKTGIWGAQRLKLGSFVTEDLYDPETNIRIGCWYLRQLAKEFDNNMDLVIAAYNGGSGNVSDWLQDRDISYTGKSLDKIPFKETENYLKKVKSYHLTYKKLYTE